MPAGLSETAGEEAGKWHHALAGLRRENPGGIWRKPADGIPGTRPQAEKTGKKGSDLRLWG